MEIPTHEELCRRLDKAQGRARTRTITPTEALEWRAATQRALRLLEWFGLNEEGLWVEVDGGCVTNSYSKKGKASTTRIVLRLGKIQVDRSWARSRPHGVDDRSGVVVRYECQAGSAERGLLKAEGAVGRSGFVDLAPVLLS